MEYIEERKKLDEHFRGERYDQIAELLEENPVLWDYLGRKEAIIMGKFYQEGIITLAINALDKTNQELETSNKIFYKNIEEIRKGKNKNLITKLKESEKRISGGEYHG